MPLKQNNKTKILSILSLVLTISLLFSICVISNLKLKNAKLTAFIKSQQNVSELTIIDNQKQIKSLKDRVLGLTSENEKILLLTKKVNKTSIKEVRVPYLITDTMYQKDTGVQLVNLDSFIRVPKIAVLNNDSLNIQITVTKSGIVVDSLTITDTAYTTVTEYRKNWFSRKQYYIKTKHTSPYVRESASDNYIYRPKSQAPKFVGLGLLFILLTQLQ